MNNRSPLPASTPEAQGVSSAAIAAFVDAIHANEIEMHSFELLRHGQRIAEGWWSPYAPEFPHMLFSLSKSFASTAVGLAVSEGRLSVDDPVISFFPEELPGSVSNNLAAMKVRHLLSMSTGHAVDATQFLRDAKDGDWVKAFLHSTIDEAPGSLFVYNSAATYMCSAIVQKLTRLTLLEYLTPRLFKPLGITDATWESCPKGINVGGWGLSIKTDEIARFGQMYLQKGVWQGKQIVPAEWVEEATSKHIANNHPGKQPWLDWGQGYGYQFWRCQHGAYRGDGAFGQYCVVMPEQDAVLAINSGQNNMQIVLDQVWEHLLPAMGASPLPENPNAYAALQEKLATLGLPLAQGKSTSLLAAEASGLHYLFPENSQEIEAVTFSFGSKETVLVVRDQHGEHQIACGNGKWLAGVTNLGTGNPKRVAASGAWTDEDKYEAILRFYETPFATTFNFRFLRDELFLDSKMNVSFGPTVREQLVGKTG